MSIIKYNNFLEKRSQDIWIEDQCNKDKNILKIVSEYLKDIDPKIRIFNAINTLELSDKNDMIKRINNYLNNVDNSDKFTVSANVETNINESYGENIFSSFLKVITGIGKKDIITNIDNCPDDFLFHIEYDNINVDQFKSVVNRFKSIQLFFDGKDIKDINIYYGINTNGNLEYGFILNGKDERLGEFGITQRVLNSLKKSDLKSLSNFKSYIKDFSFIELKKLSHMKKSLLDFDHSMPYSEKSKTKCIDKTLLKGFKINDDDLTDEEIEKYKNEFKKFVNTQKWMKNCQIKLINKRDWLYYCIKIKE